MYGSVTWRMAKYTTRIGVPALNRRYQGVAVCVHARSPVASLAQAPKENKRSMSMARRPATQCKHPPSPACGCARASTCLNSQSRSRGLVQEPMLDQRFWTRGVDEGDVHSV